MRLNYSKHLKKKEVSRLKKKARIRRRVKGSEERPRLCIFRSAKHLYAQVIDDVTGRTLVSTSTLELESKSANKDTATLIGKEIAKKALEKKISNVVFDRNGYLYHGRVKAIADGAREAGLHF